MSLQSKSAALSNQMEFLNAEIAAIPPTGAWAPAVEIPISEVDTYVYLALFSHCAVSLSLEIRYSSEYYKKELERFTQLERYASRTATYEVQSGRKVVMSFQKRYRFESTCPFVISDKVHRTSDVRSEP